MQILDHPLLWYDTKEKKQLKYDIIDMILTYSISLSNALTWKPSSERVIFILRNACLDL